MRCAFCAFFFVLFEKHIIFIDGWKMFTQNRGHACNKLCNESFFNYSSIFLKTKSLDAKYLIDNNSLQSSKIVSYIGSQKPNSVEGKWSETMLVLGTCSLMFFNHCQLCILGCLTNIKISTLIATIGDIHVSSTHSRLPSIQL